MTFWPLLITLICYLWTAAGFVASKNYGLAAAFFFYACAQCGFLYIALQTK